MYVILFGTAVHLLRKDLSVQRSNSTVKKCLLCVAVASFILSTAAIAVCFLQAYYLMASYIQGLWNLYRPDADVQQLQTVTAVLLNLQIMIADALLVRSIQLGSYELTCFASYGVATSFGRKKLPM